MGLHIGELYGGGLVLGYRCSSRCRHCLYACHPGRRDGLPDGDELERVLDLLAERAPRARFHVGGGEPFLNIELVRRAIDGLASRGLTLDYVETNAGWVKSEDHAAEVLEDLALHGLEQVLVSVSPFHAEFIPPEKPRMLIAAAERVLAAGAFVWLPDFWPDVGSAPKGGRLDLDALLSKQGEAYAVDLANRYGLVPAARAGRYLVEHGLRSTWQQVAVHPPCAERLTDTSHFHVDGQGRYVPGLCAGIVLPLEEVPGDIDLSRYPLLADLVSEGPGALVERAEGLEPAEAYCSACDLCTHVRRFLFAQGYAELGPPGFYDSESMSFA